MKSVSNEYKATQESHVIKPVRKVELFRRLADGSGWDAASIDITGEISELDRLSWKLDTDTLGEFKSNNIRIKADNTARLWDQNSSRFSGFLLFRSKIRISLGLTLEAGEETFPMFTGIINDVLETSEDTALELDILSLDVLLEDAEAKKAAIQVSNELAGTGDGVSTDFQLSQFPVGEVVEVRVNGAPVRFGTEVTVSGLNDPNNQAEITFQLTPPPSGAQVRVDYIAWKTNQPIEDAVNDLLSSVPQVEKLVVEPVSFETSVGGSVLNLERTILHTTQGDFSQYELKEAKVISEDPPPQNDGQVTIDAYDSENRWRSALGLNVNFKRIPNAVCPLWTSQYEADFLPTVEKQQVEGDPSDPWQESITSGVTRSVGGGVLSVSTPTQTASTYRLANPKLSSPTNGQCVSVRIRVTNISSLVLNNNGIYVGTMKPSFIADNQGVQIVIRTANQVFIQSGGTLFGPYTVDLTQYRVLRIGFVAQSFTTGVWNFYVDGTFIAEGPLGAAPSQAEQGVYLKAIVVLPTDFQIDFLRFFGGEITLPQAIWEKVIDYGIHLAGLTSASLIPSLGPFFAEVIGAANNFRYFASFSQDGFNYGPETLLSSGNFLGVFSSLSRPRYMKFRIHMFASEESAPNGVTKLWLPSLVISPEIDGGPGIVAWDFLHSVQSFGNGGVFRFTAAKANMPSGFGFYSNLGSNDEILSDDQAVSQGGQVPQRMIAIFLLNTSGPTPPLLKENRFILHTDIVVLTMSNYGNLSVLSAIQELARIADFEIGMDGDGRFFFRNKTQAALPVLSLDESNIEKVISFIQGWDRVFNSIRARFGEFEKASNSNTEGDPSPTSEQRFGTRPLTVGGGSLLFQTDVDLATVTSKRYFARYKEPKKRLTVVTHFRPELELGDRVTYEIANPRIIGQSVEARILGIAHDLMNFRTELDLQEI